MMLSGSIMMKGPPNLGLMAGSVCYFPAVGR